MSGRTPGPWTVGADNVVYDERHRDPICDASYRGEEVSAANANLIAGAPDLLEALDNLLWHAEQLEELIESERGKGRSAEQLYAAGEMHNYMIEAKKAIARAKGEHK